MTLVGILGGGQLARMLALAGHPLGVRCRVLEPAADAPAAAVAEHVCAALDDPEALARLTVGCDVVTCEIEHLPDAALDHVEGASTFHPSAKAVRVARDRLDEKRFVRSCGIATADFLAIDDEKDLERAGRELGFPFVMKTRTHGFDGRGQAVVRSEEEAAAAFSELRPSTLIAEAFVPFDRELSVVVARSSTGEVASYPVVENHHVNGQLHSTLAPAPRVDDALEQRIRELARTLVESLGYVGVLTIELFQQGDDLRVNELAPRVHNSGHWTIEGAETSQFENHLRAILGLPLGSTAPLGRWVMFNVLGVLPDRERVLGVPGAHLHLYGKEPRPERKLGHVNCRVRDPEADRPALAARLGLG